MRDNTFFVPSARGNHHVSSTIAAERRLQFDRLDRGGSYHGRCWLCRDGDEGSGTASSGGAAGANADARRS